MAVNTSGVAGTPTMYDGVFKRVYADNILNLIPEEMFLVKNLGFKDAKKLGDSYEQPVALSYEHGFTFGGVSGEAYALNQAVTGTTGNARVQSSEITLKSLISKATIERSMTSEAAFIRGTKMKVENMVKSHSKELEIIGLYGATATGRGTLSAISGSSTTRTLTISAATWSAGMWAGMKNAQLDIYQTTSKLNSNAVVTVTSIDFANRQLAVSGNGTDLTAVDSAVSANNVYLFRAGAYGNVPLGLDAIATTSSGNLFNLSTTNELWKSSTYTVSGDLTMEHCLNALDQAYQRGGEGEFNLLIPSPVFIDLLADEAALRRYGAEKKASQGFETIEFYSQAGTVKIVPHRFVKGGEAFLFPKKALSWIGAYKGVKFEDAFGSNVFWPVDGYNGYEMRSYSDCAMFSEAPGHIVKLTSITP
jgi:hypothetical protein